MSELPQPEWHTESRRLLGPNRDFAAPGVILEALPPAAFDDQAIRRWQSLVQCLTEAIGWPEVTLAVHRHLKGASLAFSAPPDQLDTACDINEISWDAAASDAALDITAVLQRLRASAEGEREPALLALIEAAGRRDLPVFLDDDDISIGIGAKSRCWPRAALPDPEEVPWAQLAKAPLIMVTGTNGKTTTVRLCASIAAAAGFQVGFTCTEGVVINGQTEVTGDYAGPAGARRVVRNPLVSFAVLESARGGILRRGLATHYAQVSVVTNISPDHFGEYGIDRLEDLADAKLAVARVVHPSGMLVVNGDSPLLLERARTRGARLGLFALDFDHPALAAHRAEGGAVCGVSRGRLLLSIDDAPVDLGDVTAMPLTIGGVADYNIGNIAAAALASAACGIAPAVIAGALTRFGGGRDDNPGRMERWRYSGTEVLADYAHNPDGMRGLLAVAANLRGQGRLGMMLGQAGNRRNEEIADLAKVALSARPDLVVLKDEPGFLRGRAVGEVPGLLRQALIEGGLPADRAPLMLDEMDAAFCLLAWANPGDVVVLPLHGSDNWPKLRAILTLVEKIS